MKRLYILLFAALAGLFSASYAESYKQVKIYLQNKDADIRFLAQKDYDLEHAVLEKDNSVTLFMSETEFNEFRQLGFRYDILINDWDSHFQSLPKLNDAERQSFVRQSKQKYNVEGFGFGSLAGYYTYAEMNQRLDSMKLQFPNLITTKFLVGNSIEDRPIYGVKISDNPDVNENEPEVFFMGMLHAREPQGMMTILYYMYYLLENYNTNPSVKYLVDNRQIYFIPIANPDGYEYNRTSNPSGGGMWRKNRKNNSGSFGVDLNRNYGPFRYWNAPNGGSSTSPSSDTYRGTAPFSEPETEALRVFVQNKKIKTSLSYHTYSNLLIYPYGALSRETPDSLIFREFASDMVQYNGYQPGTDMQTVGYSTRGNSDDWLYDGDSTARGKIFGMTPEVGSSSDGFWPAQSRIFPLAQENVLPNLYYTWVAGEYVALKSVSYDRQYINPGDNVQMSVTLKNKGLSAGRSLRMELSSANQYVTVQNGIATFDSISARSTYTVPTPLTFTVSASAPIQQKVKLALKTFTGTSQMSSDTFSITLGTPSFVFKDTTNNPAALWTITASPATPKWEATDQNFYSSPTSFTDSKTGSYASSATVTMTLTNPVNLAGLANPKLSFWMRHDIEKKWDCGVVQISTNNGSSWTTVAGQYTKPASGSGKQVPTGMPCYEGMQSIWVQEEIDLSAYANTSVKIRFELRTDGSVNNDGWYIDDIGIYTYAVTPSITWSNALNVKDNGNVNQDLTFGFAPNATDGIDPALGEISLPPLPPSGVFDARFELPVTPAEFSFKDFRKDTLTSAAWLLRFQPGAGGFPFTFTWNSAALPAGRFFLKDLVTGTLVNVDMKAQNSYTLTNNNIFALKVEYSKQSCVNLALSAGWNLVSVPLAANVMSPAQCFPQANSPMFSYNNGYVTASTLENGKGYWIRYAGQSTENICGNLASMSSMPLVAGWNLIGVLHSDIHTAAVTTTPPGILSSAFFGYANGYVNTSTLSSGKGYWVRTSQSGQINLPASLEKSGTDPVSVQIPKDWTTITIQDAAGNTAKLYAATSADELHSVVLPPLPPDGIFDARFSDDVFASSLAHGKKAIAIAGAVFPVTISVSNGSFTITDGATGGKLIREKLSGSSAPVVIHHPLTHVEISNNALPAEYSLGQNYPNPFNPLTTIQFGLPEKAFVTLTVFNQLGETVETIVASEQEAGYHKFDWNAKDLPSGIYFYELRAGKFQSVKKLILMK